MFPPQFRWRDELPALEGVRCDGRRLLFSRAWRWAAELGILRKSMHREYNEGIVAGAGAGGSSCSRSSQYRRTIP